MADGRSHSHESQDTPQSFGLSFVSPSEQGNRGPSAQLSKNVTIDTNPANLRSPDGLLSPQSANLLSSNSSGENSPDLRRERFNPEVGSYEDFKRNLTGDSRQSRASVNDYQAYLQSSERERLRGTPSFKSAYESECNLVPYRYPKTN